jgi:hypothetical protein
MSEQQQRWSPTPGDIVYIARGGEVTEGKVSKVSDNLIFIRKKAEAAVERTEQRVRLKDYDGYAPGMGQPFLKAELGSLVFKRRASALVMMIKSSRAQIRIAEEALSSMREKLSRLTEEANKEALEEIQEVKREVLGHE